MSLNILNRSIEKVRLIDDDANVRKGYRYSVEDLDLSAEEVDGPIKNIGELIRSFDKSSEAAICDFNLMTKDYSTADGDVVVSSLYSLNIPAVLCTRWAGHLPERVRYRRRRIPVVLPPNDLSADTLSAAFEACVGEFSGNYSDFRRPWRAMIRVESAEEVGGGHFRLSVVVPSWDSSIGLTYIVPSNETPDLASICQRASSGEIVRVFGQVNLGVESVEDIYIDQWSI